MEIKKNCVYVYDEKYKTKMFRKKVTQVLKWLISRVRELEYSDFD